ncbi:restriction endonuclease subunit S [Fictibacillus sp. Mic-4]|uniref:restriction endonuclease subunit S n=1 Tax=Fictibacillus sp. Mic-4 TaxID=3132826 RepID=UPI003CECD94A
MESKVTISEIAQISSGSTAPKDQYFSDEGIPFIRAGHLEKLINGFPLNNLPKISKSIANGLKLKKVDKGSILFAKSGMSSTKNRVYQCSEETYIVNHLASITPDSTKVEPEYLKYFLQWFNPSRLIIDESYPSIRLSDIANIQLKLSNIETQRKIVSLLNKAQKLIFLRKNQIAALSSLTQSVFLEMFGDPVINRRKWVVRPLEDFLKKIDSGWSPKSESFPAKEGEKGVLKLSAVTKGVYLPTENKALYVDTPFKEQYEVKKGDLLITRKNTKELVGACAYVFNTPTNLMIPDTIFRLVFKSVQYQIHPIFLWRLLNNNSFRHKVTGLAEGSAGSMPNISKKNLLKLRVIVPPIELQEQFSKKVIKIEEQKDLLNKGLLILENNFNSLMHRAFKGELFND